MSELPDLANFGAGIDNDDPNPEDKDNRRLSKWLAAQKDVKIFWDRKKTYGHGTFSISTRRRPDLLIRSKVNNYAVEVKRSESLGSIADGGLQTFQYWQDIERDKSTYRVNGDRVDIDSVLLATREAPAGRLFKSESKISNPRDRDRAANKGYCPNAEYLASKSFFRLLYRWARWQYNKKQDSMSGTTGVGILVSSALDGDNPDTGSCPAAYSITPGGGQGNNHWDYIPFYKKPEVSS